MSDPWIRVHANLHRRPVIARARQSLGVSTHEAIGLMVEFWGSVAQHSTDGRIGDLPDRLIDEWGGWTGQPGHFAQFIREHHTDADGRVREWDEYAGKWEETKRSWRERQARHRERKAQNTPLVPESHGDITVMSPVTRRNEAKLASGNGHGDITRDSASLICCLNKLNAGMRANPLVTNPREVDFASGVGGVSWFADGIPLRVCEAVIEERCATFRPKSGGRGQIGHLSYFDRAIRERWDALQAQGANAGDPDPVRTETLRRQGYVL